VPDSVLSKCMSARLKSVVLLLFHGPRTALTHELKFGVGGGPARRRIGEAAAHAPRREAGTHVRVVPVPARMSSVQEHESDDSTLDLAGPATAHAAQAQASRSPSSVSGMSELAREAERLVEALDTSDAQALAEAVQRSDSPVAAKLRSYQGKPLPAVQHDPAPSARSGSSGISELARESEELLNAIHASAAAPLVSLVCAVRPATAVLRWECGVSRVAVLPRIARCACGAETQGAFLRCAGGRSAAGGGASRSVSAQETA